MNDTITQIQDLINSDDVATRRAAILAVLSYAIGQIQDQKVLSDILAEIRAALPPAGT